MGKGRMATKRHRRHKKRWANTEHRTPNIEHREGMGNSRRERKERREGKGIEERGLTGGNLRERAMQNLWGDSSE
jgi:hypothetical protein